MPAPAAAASCGSVPPLLPHITADQARAYTTAILKGGPGGWNVVRRSVREMVASYLPR